MSPIHLFVPSFRIEECLDEIRDCLENGWTGLGYKTVDFERAWSAFSRLPHAHFLNSATAGLHLAFKLLREADGWRDGDEVITTPLTFVSTNHAILYERLRPVFADVDEFLCLDPGSIRERIGPRTRAVCFVGLGGNAGRYPGVASHQLVRHRIASYSQQSQRYVAADEEFERVLPPSIAADGTARAAFDREMQRLGKLYRELLAAGIPAEDARFVLPNAAATRIMVTRILVSVAFGRTNRASSAGTPASRSSR